MLLFDKSKNQIEALLGDAVASAVQYAKDNLIPIVIEDIYLDKKKGGRSSKTNRKGLDDGVFSIPSVDRQYCFQSRRRSDRHKPGIYQRYWTGGSSGQDIN